MLLNLMHLTQHLKLQKHCKSTETPLISHKHNQILHCECIKRVQFYSKTNTDMFPLVHFGGLDINT